MNRVTREDAFVLSCLPPDQAHREGTLATAKKQLASHPELGSSCSSAALVTGNVAWVNQRLDADELSATESLGPKNWPPLLYVCFSLFLRDAPGARPRFHEIARTLLERGADPNSCYMDGGERESALYAALGIANDVTLGTILLDAGADVNDADASYHVAEHKSMDAVELLFRRGVSDDLRATTLLHRLDYEDPESIRTILSLGADPNGRGQWGKTPLHQAIMRGRSLEIIDLLIENGADVDALRDDGRSPFALAARSGQRNVVERLRAAGADETLGPADELLAACALEEPERAFAIVIGDPTRVANMTKDERATICEAARDGRTEPVRLMLESGIAVDTPGLCGATPLHWAAWSGQSETVELLLNRSAPIHARCETYDRTALGWCVAGSKLAKADKCNYPSVAKQLLDAGSAIEPFMLSHAGEELKELLRR